jgi:hypothetical protein
MGSTPYYGIPYPDSTNAPDGPTQMKAIGDKVEALLKSGFTMPSGDLVIGDIADTTQRWLRLKRTDTGSQYDCYIGVPAGAGGGLIFEVYKAGATTVGLILRPNGVIQQQFGGQWRPIPFASFSANQSIPTGGGGASITLPAGRFTASPTCSANLYGSTTYHANVAIISTTSVNVVTNAASAAACDVMCFQMTPTGVGLRQNAAPPLPKTAVTRTATCQVEGCENAGEALEVISITDETLIVCGVCGTDIADVAGGTAAARRKASRKGDDVSSGGSGSAGL